MSWTEERIQILRQRWNEGYSASLIAAELGQGVTRNAILGRVHRMRLPMRLKVKISGKPKFRTRAPAVRKINSTPQRTYKKAPVRAMPKAEPAGLGEMRLLTIMELKSGSCRWPIGEPAADGFRFCGNDALEHSSYCPFHKFLSIGQGTRSEREAERV